MWFYVQHVLVGHQRAYAEQHEIPRGNLSDLYPRWLGARELLLHHRDPYSAEVTREIQIGYWGRPLEPTRSNDPKDQAGFAYPVYVVFLLAPTIALPFSAVQTGFRWFLLILTAATVPLWLRTLRWRPSLTTTSILIVLTLGSFQAVQGIKVQQLGLLVGGLVAGSAALLAERRPGFAGVLLAFSTIKPQLVFPVLVWLLLWAFSDWHGRQNFAWGLVSTRAVLLAAAEYVLPGWVWRFRDAVISYRQYNDGAESVLDVLLGPQLGKPLAVLILLALTVLWWRFRRASNDSPAFNLILVLTLVGTVVIVPKAAPYHQVLLLPGILVVAEKWGTLWQNSGPMRIIFMICCLLMLWPWIASFALTAASPFFAVESIQNAWAVPLWTILPIPLAVMVLLLSGFGEFTRGSTQESGPASSVKT